MLGLPINIIKIYNVKGADIMFEVKYLWNGWVRKDGVNANLVSYYLINLKYPK